MSITEAVPQPYLYGSYWYDRELGWYWLSVRDYDPTLEWFIQPDPSLQDGTRSYVYAKDDPIDASDPSDLGCDGAAICPQGIIGPTTVQSVGKYSPPVLRRAHFYSPASSLIRVSPS